MLTVRAGQRPPCASTQVGSSVTSATPMSTVNRPSAQVSVLTPPRVAIGSGAVTSTAPSRRRCSAKTRMPLPHISEVDPSALW